MARILDFAELITIFNESISAQLKQSNEVGSALLLPADVLTLRSSFPRIKEEHILAIINHEFCSWDLYKLDPKYHDRNPTFTLNCATGEAEIMYYDAEDYLTPDHLRGQLLTYVSMLITHLTLQQSKADSEEAGANLTHIISAQVALLKFMTHFESLITKYEWPSVFAYTMEFFDRRRVEMHFKKTYDAWGVPDQNLTCTHLFGQVKAHESNSASGSSSKLRRRASVCRKYSLGKCFGETCRFGRLHQCSSCGEGHPLSEHSE